MAPHHIDDLPPREEREATRQLMLGLIDDLPDERRGTRQLMMWGLVGLAVALFAGGVFVTAPRQNSTVGSGQNASGETARIEQTATALQLSDAQRQQIRQSARPGDAKHQLFLGRRSRGTAGRAAAESSARDFIGAGRVSGQRLCACRQSARNR